MTLKEPISFRVSRRNFGHWDIDVSMDDCKGRIFAIRGGPGKYFVRHEHPEDRAVSNAYFSTVGACMSYITDKLMYELIVVEGQTPAVIEGWNL